MISTRSKTLSNVGHVQKGGFQRLTTPYENTKSPVAEGSAKPVGDEDRDREDLGYFPRRKVGEFCRKVKNFLVLA